MKNFKNWITFGEVISKSLVSCFFDSQCINSNYILSAVTFMVETCYGLLKKCHFKQLLLQIHPFNSPFSGTTWESRYPKGKTNLDFTEASVGPYASLHLAPDR